MGEVVGPLNRVSSTSTDTDGTLELLDTPVAEAEVSVEAEASVAAEPEAEAFRRPQCDRRPVGQVGQRGVAGILLAALAQLRVATPDQDDRAIGSLDSSGGQSGGSPQRGRDRGAGQNLVVDAGVRGWSACLE